MPLRLPGPYAATVVLQVPALPGERGNPFAVTTVSPVLREKLVIRLVCCVLSFNTVLSKYKLAFLYLNVASLN